MMVVKQYQDQKIGVFGLGKAGNAVVASLVAGGAQVYAWDDSETSVTSGRMRIADGMQDRASQLTACPYTEWPWQELKALVLSPGVPLTHPRPHEVVELAKRHNCPVFGDIELLYRACPNARYLGITGTNGKSTTTTLIGHILTQAGAHVAIGGNLGTPALALEPLDDNGIYVLELSSYQLDLLHTARFDIAVFLNITPDHLDRHGSMDGYIASKRHLFDRQRAQDTAIIAIDDPHTRRVADMLKRTGSQQVMTVSMHAWTESVYVSDGVLHDKLDGQERMFDLTGIVSLTGRHNWQNAAAAYAACRVAGVAPDIIYKAMQSFPGLRHRLQQVATIHGVRFVNDSKATNADATAHALRAYDHIYWIAGGKSKAGGIATLEEYFPKIVHAFLIGEAEEEFARTLEKDVPHTRSGTLKAAVKQAADMAFVDGRHGAVVLLSPACASFDQWKNFEERGDAFCVMVEALMAAESFEGRLCHAF